MEVHWEDSESVAMGWRPRTEYARHVASPQSYRTVGYWMGSAGGRVMVATSADPRSGSVNHMMAIPRRCIRATLVVGRAGKPMRKALR